MRLKTWLVAALGLGSLVVLIALSMLASSHSAQDIYAQLDELNTHHRNVEVEAARAALRRQPVGHLRPRLPARRRARAGAGYREQLAEFRQTNMATLAELRQAGRPRRRDREPAGEAG